MPREPIFMTRRFEDVSELWDRALHDNGLVISVADSKAAMALLFKLNTYRRMLRNQSSVRYVVHDEYVVRRTATQVSIVKRVKKDWLAHATKLDGSPLSPLPKSTREPTPEEAAADAKYARWAEHPEERPPLTAEEKAMMDQVQASLEATAREMHLHKAPTLLTPQPTPTAPQPTPSTPIPVKQPFRLRTRAEIDREAAEWEARETQAQIERDRAQAEHARKHGLQLDDPDDPK